MMDLNSLVEFLILILCVLFMVKMVMLLFWKRTGWVMVLARASFIGMLHQLKMTMAEQYLRYLVLQLEDGFVSIKL